MKTKRDLHERLLKLPRIQTSLLEHGGAGLEISDGQLIEWVIKKCFPLQRRKRFVEEADESFTEFARFVENRTGEQFNSSRQIVSNKFATVAAAFYLLGAVAGAAALIEDPTEPAAAAPTRASTRSRPEFKAKKDL